MLKFRRHEQYAIFSQVLHDDKIKSRVIYYILFFKIVIKPKDTGSEVFSF